MLPRLSEAWDRGDDWTGLASGAERRRRQNRLNQRAYRRRRHHVRLTLNEISSSSATETLHSQRLGPCNTQLVTTQGQNTEVHGLGMREHRFFLLLRWPELRHEALELLNRALANWSLNSPIPQDLPKLTRLNAFDALSRNAMLLHIPFEFLETDEFSSLFNYYCPESQDMQQSLPYNLRPTALQRSVIHHSWLDLFPFPGMRDNILRGLQRGDLDEDELCDQLCCDLLNFNTDSTPSLLLWGDSWDATGWEFSPSFFHRWGFLLNGCPGLLQTTNYWREARGEMKIEFVLN